MKLSIVFFLLMATLAILTSYLCWNEIWESPWVTKEEFKTVYRMVDRLEMKYIRVQEIMKQDI
jgi:hypothetical protein